MSKPIRTKTPRPPRTAPTLADVVVRRRTGLGEYRVTGRQIAQLLTVASERTQGGPPLTLAPPGRWAYRLRGLGYLIFPDAGDSLALDDARALVDDLLCEAAAELAAGDGPIKPEEFLVSLRPGSGR